MTRMDERIRAREVRVIGPDGKQLGVMETREALSLAKQVGLNLVEISGNANPPVCRIVDYGKYKYEKSKKEKESKKHQHSNKVKEVQLRPNIDPHDFKIKVDHAIDFLCEDMKLKINLRFRGRENAHKEFGFQTVEKFIDEIAPYGTPDFQPKIVGRGINLMISPLPKNKRARHPNEQNRPPEPPRENPQQQSPEASSGSPQS